MAGDNKTLGRFELVGIPPAPRGVPQVEVTFDIDANGIVHVGAKDLGTGKQQSIQITANSGLNEDEIQRMVHEAEEHSAEDRNRRQLIEARNQLDSLIYLTERSLKEHGSQLEAADRAGIESALEDARRKLADGQSAEELKRANDILQHESHKLAEQMYKRASAQQGGAGAETDGFASDSTGGYGGGGSTPPPGKDDGVVDADFEEVK
jgi:molecular chaperone DnaK